MANYANLLAQIAANIYSNNNQDITGDGLQLQLNAMVASLGAGYQFMGVATLATTPGNADVKQFYIASEPGTYTNFLDSGSDPLVVNDGEVAILKYDTAWSKEVTGAASAEGFVLNNPVNLFDKNDPDVALGYYLTSTGALSPSSAYNSSGYIKVKPSTKYCPAIDGAELRFVNFYTAQKSIISQIGPTFSFTTPNNCEYVRVTFYAAYYDTAQITEQEESRFAPFSPISGYLFDATFSGERIPVKKVGKNLLNPSGYGYAIGYYLGTNNAAYSNASYCISPYIPLNDGKLIASRDGLPFLDGGAAICYYDKNRSFLSGHTLTSSRGIATWSSGVAFVRFSIPAANFTGVQIEAGEQATSYEPYGYYISKNDLPPTPAMSNLGSQRTSGSVAAGSSITLPLIYCRYAQTLTAIINGTISGGNNVEIGRGDGVYGGGYIRLTSSQVTVWGTTYNHGLSLTSRTFVCLETDEKAVGKVIIMTSSGALFEQDVATSMGGAAYVKNNTSASITVELSLEFKKVKSPVWIIGDSYLSYDPARWPYYPINWGFTNFLMDNFSGGTASQLWTSFVNDLTLGRPKFAVWCLGMNGGTDSGGAVNNTWLIVVNYFIALCLENNITPILATIPSVPDMPHEKLNEWVRNSGHRYIDFAKAVNAQADGTWTAGLLSNDNVHPTEAGARVLASRVLLDLPEITID